MAVETMLRIYFLQQLWVFSGHGGCVVMRMDAGHAPDETTICKFRHGAARLDAAAVELRDMLGDVCL